MKIAVEGCAHGELDKIYECLLRLKEREGIQIDLLICCGDFQSVRNRNDLRTMAVPDKYKQMCTFHKYYSGEEKAPVLTIFIGGNHEASNYLQELPYGGWVAPKIYYMGRAGVIRFGDLRIGGLSGIYKGHDYMQGLWECPPYSQSSLRSVYHIRSLDVYRLSQLKEKVHVMLSHDWPRGITDYGDKEELLQRKPFFREEIESNQLGSVPAEKLLYILKPEYWFAAHMHCKFVALVKHNETDQETKFLALDKCLPKRRHLQILEIPSELDGDKCLKHDAEWLAILKNTNHLLSVKNINCHMPGPGGNERYDFKPTDEEKAMIEQIMGNMRIEENSFVQTAPVFASETTLSDLDPIMNPQTVNLCEKLGIDDPVQVIMARAGREMANPQIDVLENVSELSQDSTMGSTMSTPLKISKLSLPPPTSNESQTDKTPENVLSPEFTSFTESIENISVDCGTPHSAGKKTFKRRNISIYNTPDGDDSLSTSSSLLESDSPRTSKLPCRSDIL